MSSFHQNISASALFIQQQILLIFLSSNFGSLLDPFLHQKHLRIFCASRKRTRSRSCRSVTEVSTLLVEMITSFGGFQQKNARTQTNHRKKNVICSIGCLVWKIHFKSHQADLEKKSIDHCHGYSSSKQKKQNFKPTHSKTSFFGFVYGMSFFESVVKNCEMWVFPKIGVGPPNHPF